MRTRFLTTIAVLALLVAAGCSRDPEATKRRYLESGQRYFEKGEYDKARIEFRNALKADPRFAEAHFRLGVTQIELRQWREAEKELNAALEFDPSHRGARLRLADLLLAMGQAEAARQELGELLRANANDVDAISLLGRVYMLEKDLPRAIEAFEMAKKLAPQTAAFWTAAGVAKVGAKKFAQAEADFRRALELDPAAHDAYQNLANLFRLTGREERVEGLLRQGIEKNLHSLPLHLTQADFYYRQGRREAVEELFAAMARPPAAQFPDLHLELGDFWMDREELERAAAEFQAALAKSSDVRAEKKLISAYLTLGRLEEAERLNQTLLERMPKDVEGRSFRGALACRRGNYAEAADELQAILKEDPDSAFAHYYLGLAWMGLKKPERARSEFLECLRVQQRFPHAYLKLAQLALEAKDWRLGQEYARKALELNPQLLDGYLLLAQAYMLEGDLGEAEKAVRALRELPAPPAEFFELAARLAALKKDDASASANYEQALARSPQPLGTLSRYTDYLVSRGRTAAAIERVKQWMAGVPPQPAAYELLARLYLQHRDFAGAEAAARQALALKPTLWGPYVLLGQVYQQQGQWEKSLQQYDEALRRNPRQASLYVLAGNLLLEQAQNQKARPYFEQALAQDPDSRSAQLGLARCYAELGENLDLALSMAQKLKARQPDDAEASDTLGWVYYQKGLYRMALEHLQVAARALPENAAVQFHLGMAYSQVGEKQQARRALQQAMKLGLVPEALAAKAQQTLERLAGG